MILKNNKIENKRTENGLIVKFNFQKFNIPRFHFSVG